MNRVFNFAILCMLFSSSAWASSDNATSTLKNLLANIQQYKANFAQVITDADDNIVHEAKGKIVLARPNKLRWETLPPNDNVLVADGESVWNIDPFVEQVTIIDQRNAVKDNPIMLLTSTDEATWSKFVVRQAAANESEFFVTPKNREGQVRELTMLFDNGTLVGLTTLDAQEQTSTLLFSDISTRFPMAADTFVPDISESFMVDDQR